MAWAAAQREAGEHLHYSHATDKVGDRHWPVLLKMKEYLREEAGGVPGGTRFTCQLFINQDVIEDIRVVRYAQKSINSKK